MNDSKLLIKYSIKGKVYTDDMYQTEHYTLENSSNGNRLKLTIHPKEKLELISVSLVYNYNFKSDEKFYANGYQSWTETREYSKYDVQRGAIKLVKYLPMFKPLAYISGDYDFKKYTEKQGLFHGYTYMYIRNNAEVELWGSLSERQGFTIFNADMYLNKLTIEKDVEGVIIDSSYSLFDIVKLNGTYDEVFDDYFKLMAIKKPKIDHLAGYTSWYNYFQKIDENIILRDLDGLDRAKDTVSIFQIDDGYAPFVGDWLDKNEKDFPNGMKVIADKIHEKGYLAGIWLAPFNVQRKSRIAKEHPEWLIKNDKGKPELGCPGWGGAYTLDIYNEEARAHIKNFMSVILNEWGFDMVKLDFLYSQCKNPRNGKSRGTIMVEAMEFLRECVKDKLILGCGVPLGPAFGLVDACRTGCDADLRYEGKFYNKMHINNEIPSSQNSMMNAIFRRHLNNRAFINDPDVFFLRNYNLHYNDEQKLLMAKINNLFGNVLFVSDDVNTYDDKTVEILKKSFTKSKAKVLSAEFIDNYRIKIVYLEDDSAYKLTFNLKTGHHEVIDK